MIIEHKGDLHPQVILEDENGNTAAIHPLPEKAYIEVKEGDAVPAGKCPTRLRSYQHLLATCNDSQSLESVGRQQIPVWTQAPA